MAEGRYRHPMESIARLQPAKGIAYNGIMTLIAMFETDAGPALLGDLMLSDMVPNRSIHLPTIGDVTNEHLLEGDPYSPISLIPKISIVSPDLAFGWTGPRSFALHLAEELLALTVSGRPTPDAVESIVVKLLSPFGEQATCFAILRHEKGIRYLVRGNYQHHHLNRFGIRQAFIAGSGTNSLYEMLKMLPKQPRWTDKKAEVSQGLLALQSLMFKYEIMSKDAVRASFGGGYEVIVNDVNGFRYFDQTPVMFWGHEISGNKAMFRCPPYKLIHLYHYFNAPIIRTYHMRDIGGGFEVTREEFHNIAPLEAFKNLLPKWPVAHNELPEANVTGYMHAFAIREHGTTTPEVIAVMSSPSDDKQNGVFFRSTPETVELRVSPEFINNARAAIVDAWTLSKPK